jgi:hypothetical protein
MNQLLISKKGIFSFLVLAVILFNCNYGEAQTPLPEYSSQPSFFSFLKNFIKSLPGAVVNTMKRMVGDCLDVWRNLHESVSNVWHNNILPVLKNKAKEIVETKKPMIKEEFQKEKEEMKEEILNICEGIWQNLKEIIIKKSH